jgi:hypothetical protein
MNIILTEMYLSPLLFASTYILMVAFIMGGMSIGAGDNPPVFQEIPTSFSLLSHDIRHGSHPPPVTFVGVQQ